MTGKNPEALATAYRRAVAKSKKIKDTEITADFTPEQIDAQIKYFAELKAERDGGDWKKYIKGQRWYVEDLVKFAGLNAQERLEYEYAQAFPDTATEDELLTALEKLV